MIRITSEQAATYCAAYTKLEDVVLDNDRGMAAAELYGVVLQRAQAYQLRAKALQKERAKLVEDHAKKDGKGNKQYANPDEPDANKRVLIWHNPEKWQAAYEAWLAKFEAIGETRLEIDASPLPDDFFTKPDELKVVQGIRTGFLPLMKKAQAAHDAKAPVHKPKQKRR